MWNVPFVAVCHWWDYSWNMSPLLVLTPDLAPWNGMYRWEDTPWYGWVCLTFSLCLYKPFSCFFTILLISLIIWWLSRIRTVWMYHSFMIWLGSLTFYLVFVKSRLSPSTSMAPSTDVETRWALCMRMPIFSCFSSSAGGYYHIEMDSFCVVGKNGMMF